MLYAPCWIQVARRFTLSLSHGGPLVSEFRLPGINLPLELKGVVRWSDSSHSRAGVRSGSAFRRKYYPGFQSSLWAMKKL